MSTNDMKSTQGHRQLALVSAVAFALVTVVAFVALGGGSSAPTIGASPTKIASFYLAHHAKETAAGDLLAVVAALLAILTATWRPLIKDIQGIWSVLFVSGGLIGAASFLVAGVAQVALASGADHHFDPTALQTLNALAISSGLAFTTGIGILLFGAAGCLIPTLGTLRVAGWIALPLAIIDLTPAGVAVFPLNAAWIVAVGVLLALRSRTPATHTPSCKPRGT